MKYMGSKSRIAPQLVPVIQKYIDESGTDTYLELFVGGANVIDKIMCDKRVGFDINPYLIALLVRVQQGLPLYDEVPFDLYCEARNAYKNNDTSKFEEWQIGNIGFLASYNGRFFDGGYAKPNYTKTPKGLVFRDYYREAKDNLLSQAPNLKGVEFYAVDYRDVKARNCVIYLDPPYKGTKKYSYSPNFDYEVFWDFVRLLSKDNCVLVSELNAPDDFEVVWEQDVLRSIKATDKTRATEKLFKYKFSS